MSKRHLKPEPFLSLGDWECYEESYGMHIVVRPKDQRPPVSYTLVIPWSKIRGSLKRRDRQVSHKKRSE